MKNHFKFSEFIQSDTAKRRNIENIPDWDEIEHLKELRDFLNPLREAWGSAINITSGYRSTVLNVALGGVPTSAHKLGYAADLQPANGELEEFIKFLQEYLVDKDYDQCILESSKSTRWVHLGIKNKNGEQRRQLFKIQ